MTLRWDALHYLIVIFGGVSGTKQLLSRVSHGACHTMLFVTDAGIRIKAEVSAVERQGYPRLRSNSNLGLVGILM